MKLPSLFSKIPKYKRFNYTPRHYDPQEEERKEREERLQRELRMKGEEVTPPYRSRIAGSFRVARPSKSKSYDPSVNLIRLIIMTFLAVWVIAYLQYGNIALYGLILIVPFYLWLKFFRR